jgi:hypothetical protein
VGCGELPIAERTGTEKTDQTNTTDTIEKKEKKDKKEKKSKKVRIPGNSSAYT